MAPTSQHTSDRVPANAGILYSRFIIFLSLPWTGRLTVLKSVQTSCTLLGMFLGGVILSYKIHHKYVLVAACTILTAMCGSMASVHSGQTVRGCTLIAFAGASIGVIETASRSLLPLSCPDEDIGAALGVLGTIGYAAAAIASKFRQSQSMLIEGCVLMTE